MPGQGRTLLLLRRVANASGASGCVLVYMRGAPFRPPFLEFGWGEVLWKLPEPGLRVLGAGADGALAIGMLPQDLQCAGGRFARRSDVTAVYEADYRALRARPRAALSVLIAGQQSRGTECATSPVINP